MDQDLVALHDYAVLFQEVRHGLLRREGQVVYRDLVRAKGFVEGDFIRLRFI
jgi:hypothetical protein